MKQFQKLLFLSTAILLTGCASERFQGFGSGPSLASRPAIRNAPDALEPLPAISTPSVSSSPLAPPPGSNVGTMIDQNQQRMAAIDPTTPPPVTTDVSPRPQISGVESPRSQTPPAPSRNNVLGGWTAREASGSSCRVTLSSSPALDLYRASTSGCASKDLSRVTAWDFRDGEVYLYQPGGSVAARLKADGSSMNGSLAKSGAPLTMAR